MGYLGNFRAKPSSIVTADIAAGQITTALIADDGITAAKIADDAVVAAAIADNAVVTAAINADAVTAAKIGADQIGNSELNLGSNYAFTGTVTGAGGGKIVQAQYMKITSNVTINGGPTDTGLTLNITPSSASNKVLIIAACHTLWHAQNANWWITHITFVRDSTNIYSPGWTTGAAQGGNLGLEVSTLMYLDSPSSTSQLTYKITGTGYSGRVATFRSEGSSLVLMEIGA
mgnify:CR=1 FL=1